MPWVKLDDQFTDHPKVVEAGPLAGWLYVCGLAYCARQLTDGFIPTRQLRRLLPTATVGKLAQRLVETRLWEPTPGGFRVHDYLQYNPTRQQTLALREQKAEAGRRGGKHKPSRVLSRTEAECSPSGSSPVPVPSVPSPSERQPERQTAVHDLLSPLPAAESERSARPKSLEPRYSAEFEAWWSAYPRKREKVDAYAAYHKTLKAGASDDVLLTAARNCASYVEEQGTEERFIPLPATFLGPSRKWLDFRDGVPRPVARTTAAINGRHGRPSAFDQIELAKARIRGETA